MTNLIDRDDDLIRRGDALAAVHEADSLELAQHGESRIAERIAALEPVTPAPHVNETPKTEHDAGNVLTPAPDAAQAYREGWAFAYRQWEATGSVPQPTEKPHDHHS